MLQPVITSLNQALEQLPDKFAREQAAFVYNKLCSKPHFCLPSTQKNFDLQQIIKCVPIRFPEKTSSNIIVSEDRM